MPWGYNLQGKDGARDLEGGPSEMVAGSRGTVTA